MKLIANEAWTEKDLLIRGAVPEDTQRLKEICDSWDDKVMLEGDAFTEDYIDISMSEGSLPPVPGAVKEKNAFMVMVNDSNETVGFFEAYQGYPDDETLWIGMFMIDKKYQSMHYGQKAIQSVISRTKQFGWRRIGIGVYLKNWKGLRFWSRNGFDRIDGIFGDKEYSESTNSLIRLYHDL